jgi:hypothetical protein
MGGGGGPGGGGSGGPGGAGNFHFRNADDVFREVRAGGGRRGTVCAHAALAASPCRWQGVPGGGRVNQCVETVRTAAPRLPPPCTVFRRHGWRRSLCQPVWRHGRCVLSWGRALAWLWRAMLPCRAPHLQFSRLAHTVNCVVDRTTASSFVLSFSQAATPLGACKAWGVSVCDVSPESTKPLLLLLLLLLLLSVAQ